MNQINRLGVPKRFGTEWTEADEAAMRADYQIYGVRYMMRRLNRSKGSVCAKAKQLGLSRTWVLAVVDTEANASK